MDVREKLLNLIIAAKREDPETGSFTEWLTDYLLANGVTVQKWIPVWERMPNFYPNKRRAVLVTLKDDDGKFIVTTAKYSEEHKYWYDFTESRFYRFDVLAWMLKPDAYEPLKEET